MPRIAVSIKAESWYCVSGMTVQNRPEYSYFGIYDICGKGASFLGTTLVSAMSQLTGNMNLGVGSLAVMFLIGFFFFLRTEKLS